MAKNTVDNNVVITVADCAMSKEFSKLSEETQKRILDTIAEQEEKTGGFLGKFFGTDEKKAIVYSAILIVIILVIVWVCMKVSSMCTGFSTDCRMLETAIMTVLGFLFGSGIRK